MNNIDENTINQTEPKKITLSDIASQTGLSRQTISKRLKKIGINYKQKTIDEVLEIFTEKPDTIFNQITEARISYIKEQTLKLEIDNKQKRKELIERSIIAAKLSEICTASRNVLHQLLINELPASISNCDLPIVRTKCIQMFDKVLAELMLIGKILKD